jgi:AraC-like DNA-binding protein
MIARPAATADPGLPGIRAVAATGIAEFIAEHGAPAGRVFAQTGIAAETFIEPQRRLPLAIYCELFEQAARQTGIDTFGLRFGLARATAAMGEVGEAAVRAPTLAAALGALCRFFPALQEHSAIGLRRDGGFVRVEYQIRDGRIVHRRQDAELTIGVLIALLRRVLGAGWAPETVEFEHIRPTGRAAAEALLGAPASFAAGVNAIVFRAAALAAPMPAPDRARAQALEGLLAAQVAQARPEDLVGEVQQQVRAALPAGDAGLAAVARRLGMSEPGLYRALRRREVEFSDLVRGLRRELALEYLHAPDLPLTEIALLLGYSELSAFSRAFRAWTGVSPAAYRRGVSGAVG